MNFRLLKTTHHKKHGADRICFTHHPSSVICSSTRNLDSGAGNCLFLINHYQVSLTFSCFDFFNDENYHIFIFFRFQSPCVIYPCMTIVAFVTSRAIKKGLTLLISSYSSMVRLVDEIMTKGFTSLHFLCYLAFNFA